MQGNQTPRFNTAPVPAGYSTEDADLAIEFLRGLEYFPDEWQETVVRAWLRRDREGAWCANTWGVSAARQNGKNGTLEIVEVYLMVALGLKILHTAQLLPTAKKSFKRLLNFFGQKVDDPNARFPELNAMVTEVRRTNGQEAIVLNNGGLIEVSARSAAAGRGASYDVLVVDEAQEYETEQQEALEPTISASPSGDPVTIYLGTPPAEVGERGAPFMRIRNAAVTGQDKHSAWVEFSASGDVDKMSESELTVFVADRKNWADANPALGGRLKLRTVETEHSRWSARSFARERLNMFPSPKGNVTAAFDLDAWKSRAVADAPDGDPLCFALDMNPERTRVSIAVCVGDPDGVRHVELAADSAFSEQGVSALVDWLWERCKRRVPVVVDAFSGARALLEVPLRNRGIQVHVLSSAELVQAYSMMKFAVEVEGNISHFDQEQLNLSVEGAVRVPLSRHSSEFKVGRSSSDVQLAPVLAVMGAFYGGSKFGRRRRSGERRSRGAIVG